jgi:hypothetical protein
VLSNIFVPIYFDFTNLFNKTYLQKKKRPEQILVSLTSFPLRISKIWIIVECMLRQSHPPDRIILWLAEEQFKNSGSLPKKLLKLQLRGLEIRFCKEDLRSHKKYYYAIKEYPKSILITIDDDFIYPTNLIKELIKAREIYPHSIICHRALKILYFKNEILPYSKWEYIYGSLGPSLSVFFTSGGGTLFPPNALYKDVLNKGLFTDKCLLADDVWLNVMSRLQKTNVIKIYSKYAEHIPLISSKDSALSTENVIRGLNDVQINDLKSFYLTKDFSDPFKEV